MGLDALIYSAAFLIPASIGFLTFTALTHLLDPYQYGLYSTAVNFAFFASSFFFAWVRFSVGRYEAENQGPISLRFWSLCFAAMVPLAAVTYVAISIAGFASRDVLLGVFALSCSQSLFEMSQEFRRARRQSRQFAVHNILRSALGLSVVLLLALYSGNGLYLLFGLSASFLIAAAHNLFRNFRTAQLALPASHDVWTVVSYGFGLAISGLVFSSVALISRLMVANMAGLSSAGPYNASLDLAGQIGGIVAMSVYSVIAPTIIRAHAMSDAEEVKRKFKQGGELLVAVVIPATVGLVLVAKPLTTLLTGAAFHDTLPQLLPLAVVGVAIWNLTHYYLHIAFQITSKPFMQVVAGIVQVCLVVVLTYGLILIEGVRGAAWAFIIANAITAILTFWLARTVFPIPIPYTALTKVIFGTAVMACSVYAVDGLVSSTLVQLLVSVVTGAAVYVLLAVILDLCGCRATLARLLQRIRASGASNRIAGVGVEGRPPQ